MIKKVNISLIVVAVLCSFYIAFTKNQNIVLILKDISILLTINLLYIVKKIFKVKISDSVNFIYILFIFMAHFLGVTCELYNYIFWFDKFTHFLSGILSGFAAILILVKSKNKNSIYFNILFIIAFSLMLASLWEMFEYLSSCLFNVDPQKVLETGVNDTMGDIIVAFLGALIVSLCYHFEYKNNHNLIIKTFVKQL